jgi:uncharacterized protein (TIGR03067 family)
MAPLRWLVALGAVGVVATSIWADATSDEAKKLEGDWAVTSATRDGKAVDDLPFKQMEVVGEKLATMGRDGAVQVFTFKVDPTKKPKTIDLRRESVKNGETQLGIYELDGDTLKLVLGRPNADTRPKEFTDKGHLHIVLKRQEVPQGVIERVEKADPTGKDPSILCLVGSINRKDYPFGEGTVFVVVTEKTKVVKVVDGKRQPAKLEDLKEGAKIEFSGYEGVDESAPPQIHPKVVVILNTKK